MNKRTQIGMLLLLSMGACSDPAVTPPAADESSEVLPAEPAATGGPAYIVALRVDAIEGRFIYMGAFEEVPQSEPSRDGMAELAGRWQVSAYQGHAFAWEQETGQMTSWSVEPDLSLRRGATMSLSQLGLSGWRYHAFVSPTRAYTLGLEQGVVAVWNPETMELVDELLFDPPPDFAGMDAYPLSVFLRGSQILVPLYGDNSEAERIGRRQVVGVIDTDTDSVSFLYDDRCLSSGLGHVTENGDLYLDPYQSGTFFDAYALEEGLPPPCSLRIRAGEDRFDPDFLLNYEDVLGVHAEGVWPISGTLVMALSRAPEEPLPVDQDEYWSLPQTAHRVDVEAQTAEPYAGMPAELQMQSAGQHVVDGISFYQNYRYDADDQIDFVEVGALTPEGWSKQFEIHGGDLWGILRAR